MIFSPWFHVPYTEDYATVSITLDANGTFIHEVLGKVSRKKVAVLLDFVQITSTKPLLLKTFVARMRFMFFSSG